MKIVSKLNINIEKMLLVFKNKSKPTRKYHLVGKITKEPQCFKYILSIFIMHIRKKNVRLKSIIPEKNRWSK